LEKTALAASLVVATRNTSFPTYKLLFLDSNLVPRA
jgi:hypothetical protein